MLQSIVGPPLMGVADLGFSEGPKVDGLKDSKKAGSDSFGGVLESKKRESLPRTTNEKVSASPIDGPDRSDRSKVTPEDLEQKAGKARATNEDGANKQTDGSSQRQKAILKFMDSFESEFGVPPTRIVEAMANLDVVNQTESPEKTVDQVIDQLGLDGEDVDQAKNMYMGLLAQLAKIENTAAVPLPLPDSNLGAMVAGTAMTQERASVALQKRQVLNQSLDGMNEKFWMKGGNARQAGAIQGDLADKIAQMNMQEKFAQLPAHSLVNIDETSFANGETFKSPLQLSDSLEVATPMEALSEQADEIEPIRELQDEGKEAVRGPESQVVPASAQEGQTDHFESHQQQQEQPKPEFFSARKVAKNEQQVLSKTVEKESLKNLLTVDSNLSSQGLPTLKPENAIPMGAVANTQMTSPPGMTSVDNQANIRQIMNQAQYLIKKGGGEMKVQMSPEGLGQIHMKVLVENGKVNVQMAAETNEAKKTLESSLSDLRNSLAAHKLSMDHVKVDVVNTMNTDGSMHNQTNQDQGSREQTRQFWNKFSENFGSPSQQREGFADIPNMRGYPRKRTDQPLEPIGTASVRRYAGVDNKGKGLNLVA